MEENFKDAMIGGGIIALAFMAFLGLVGAVIGFIVGTLVSWCVISLFRKFVPRKTIEQKALILLKEEIIYNRNKYPLEIVDNIQWTDTEVPDINNELRYYFSCSRSIDQNEIKGIMKHLLSNPNLILLYCYFSKLPWTVACYDEEDNFVLETTMSYEEIDAILPQNYKTIE